MSKIVKCRHRRCVSAVLALMVFISACQHARLLSKANNYDSSSRQSIEETCSKTTSILLGHNSDCDDRSKQLTTMNQTTNNNNTDFRRPVVASTGSNHKIVKNTTEEEDIDKSDQKVNIIDDSLTLDTLLLGPIFYNYFVPLNATRNAERIAREQMKERSMSAEPNNTMLYTLIGNPNITNDWCLPNCRMREYLEVGDEIDTYHALWEYCQTHSDEIVTYTHDRGSFHNTKMNEKSRRFATKAAFECRKFMIDMANETQTTAKGLGNACNVCTGKFNFLPQFHSSGNMWTAKCSYIRNLLPPKNYSATMQLMYETTLLHPTHSKFGHKFGCLKPQGLEENHLGLNRYAPERWIYSHPYLEPCEVMPMEVGKAPFGFPQTWTPVYHRIIHSFGKKLLFVRKQQFQSSFSSLVGRLYEYQYLYNNMTPPTTSWIWDAYRYIEMGHHRWLQRCLNQTNTTTFTERNIDDEILGKLLQTIPTPYKPEENTISSLSVMMETIAKNKAKNQQKKTNVANTNKTVIRGQR